MGIFEHFPYTNFHELNLDWIIDFIQQGKMDIETAKKMVEELIKNQPSEIKSAVISEMQKMKENGEFVKIAEEIITPDVNGVIKSSVNLRKILFIGDSFLGDFYNGYSNWAVYLGNRLGMTRDVNYKIFAYGGGGYVSGDNVNHMNYEQHFTNDIVPALGDTISTYSAVIVFSGPNDYNQTYEKQYGAVYSLLTSIKNAMPNAAIIGINGATLDQKFNTTQSATNDAYTAFGAINFPNAAYWMVGRDDCFLTDHLHPNEKGMRYIAGMVYNAIVTGDDSCLHYHFFHDDNNSIIITVFNAMAYFFAQCSANENQKITVMYKLPSWFTPTNNTVIGRAVSFTGGGRAGDVVLWSDGNLGLITTEADALGSFTFNGTLQLGK